MGNIRNRKRKKARKPPSKKSKIFKHGEPCDNLTGLSGAIIGTQKETFLFTQEVPPTVPNQFPSEKFPFPSAPSQNASSTKVASSKPVVTKQRSSTDLSTGATPLMSPMAFKTTKSQSNAPKDTNVETPVLTKEQLQETLIALLERDSDFVDKIHSTYLKNVNR